MKVHLIGVAAGWLALACGPAEPASSGTGGGGANTGGPAAAGSAAGGTVAGTHSAGSAHDGGGSNGGSAGADGSSSGNGSPRGTVQFGRLFGGLSASSHALFDARAHFYAKNANNGYDCSSESFGACRVSTCTPNAAEPTPKPYAGTIELSDGNTIDITLMGVKGQDYTLPSGSNVSVAGGEAIAVTTSGDEVPAFSATVAIPKVITINAPTLDAMGVAKLPRSADLVLDFDNRSADGETGTTLLVQSHSPTGSANIYCELPTATGTASIASAALSRLAAGTSLLLLTTRFKKLQAGEFEISVIGYISAMSSDKKAAATIQLE